MGTGRSGTAIYLKSRTKPISQSDTSSPPGWMSGLQLIWWSLDISTFSWYTYSLQPSSYSGQLLKSSIDRYIPRSRIQVVQWGGCPGSNCGAWTFQYSPFLTTSLKEDIKTSSIQWANNEDAFRKIWGICSGEGFWQLTSPNYSTLTSDRMLQVDRGKNNKSYERK